MRELLTAGLMREREQAAMASGAATGLGLMERAGRGTVDAVMARWPDLAEGRHRALVLCGPGNNGGDGFVVARMLAARGWDVDVFLYGDRTRLSADAGVNAGIWEGMGAIRPLTEGAADRWGEEGKRPDLLVDALFGAGLTRPLGGNLAPLVSKLAPTMRAASIWPIPHVVAVDCPSGLCMDSGRVLGAADRGNDVPQAGLTVTFHRPRPGHFLADGPRYCGALAVCDIGLAEEEGVGDADWWPAGRSGPRAVLPPRIDDRDGASSAFFRPLWKRGGHKMDHGSVLVLGGGVGQGGAARLAARAALRVGAGKVTVGVPPAALIENAAQLNAVMLTRTGSADELAAALDALKDGAAVCIGPGHGIDARTRAFAERILERCGAPGPGAVLDADALTVFRDEPEALFRMTRGRPVVLTPHMGEFGRIFPDLRAKLMGETEKGPAVSKIDAVREAAERAGCVVLLKGADTVIADADGRAVLSDAVYERAAPWLATAGSGDVLAGLIAGLLARRMPRPDALHAAALAATLHVEAARRFGPGLIAEDLPEMIPQVLAACDRPSG